MFGLVCNASSLFSLSIEQHFAIFFNELVLNLAELYFNNPDKLYMKIRSLINVSLKLSAAHIHDSSSISNIYVS